MLDVNLDFSRLHKYRKNDADLLKDTTVQLFRENHPNIFTNINALSKNEREILFLIIALKQGHVLLNLRSEKELSDLAGVLCQMDEFYHSLGGVVGYQHFILEHISQGEESEVYDIEPPKPIDLRKHTGQIDKYVLQGIEKQKEMCEILPCGGAADRLNLVDQESGEQYPAACFQFHGISLLERLIRDLEARENLYKMCFGEEIETPIVIMASNEKNNLRDIKATCEEHNWFGRSKDSFKIVVQPSVPVFDREGRWVCSPEGTLLLRPGGHGVLWRLLENSRTFNDLKAQGVKKGLVRQINNPVAGIDTGLLALVGIGYLHDKKFGFTSCPRIYGMNEGVNVVKLFKGSDQGEKKVVSNIEYCDFAALEKIDCVETFPANANTLFVDLDAAQKAQEKHPFPGLILNFKTKRELASARLESTMQNIAEPIQLMSEESAFLTFNDRSKTLSAIKRRSEGEDDFKETPELCSFQMMEEGHHLLESCQIEMPRIGKVQKPSVAFFYHPALGPLYSIIRQKIRGGRILKGSSLNLEISQLYLKDLYLDGSLSISTKSVTKDSAQCSLKNICVTSSVEISLGKNAQLIGEDLVFDEITKIEVPDHTCLILTQGQKGLEKQFHGIHNNDPLWKTEVVDNKLKLSLNLSIANLSIASRV